MTTRDLVIEILGTDDGVEVGEFARVFGGGASVINHKNPSQYRIFLSTLVETNGEALACAIHESIHCKRAKEGVEIYKKKADTWSVRERHEEEYNVTLLTEGMLHRLKKEGRICYGQFEGGMAMCRKSRKAYTVPRVAMMKSIATIAGTVSKGMMRLMTERKRQEVQELINVQTSIFSFDND